MSSLSLAKPLGPRGLTLVEVMLALAILAIGILAGVELMGRVVAAQAPQELWSAWETRLMAARERLQATPVDQLQLQLALGPIVYSDLSVSVLSGDPAIVPAGSQALALQLQLLQPGGAVDVTFPMLRALP